MNADPIIVHPKEAGSLIGVCESKFRRLMRRDVFRAAIVKIPGLAGYRVHVGRLRQIVDRLAEEQNGTLG